MSSMPGIPVKSPIKISEIGAQQRLAAGEPQLAHAQRGEQFRQAHDFIEGQTFVRIQKLVILVKLLLRHAVGAAEIATVHDRDAQVMQRAAEPIERILCAADVVNDGSHAIEITSGKRW